MLCEFLGLGLGDEVHACEVREGRPGGLTVQRATATNPVQLLQPSRKQHLRGRSVGRGQLLSPRDERFPAPADVGVVAQVGVGTPRPAAFAPVDPSSGTHLLLLLRVFHQVTQNS